MKSKIIKRHKFALATSIVTVLSVAANSSALDTTNTNVQRPPLVLEGAKVSTEAQAKELAWKSYIGLMLKNHGISATESVRVVETITLGFDVPGYAKKGDKIWETRVIDMMSGLRAIIWIHAESQQTRFLISPAVKEGIIVSISVVSNAVLPDLNLINDITLDKGDAGKALTAEEFRQMMKTAEPMSEEEFMKHAIPDGYWYKGSFTTPAGIYRFNLGAGGVNYLVTPDEALMRFKFNKEAAK